MIADILDVLRVAIKWRNTVSGDVVNVYDLAIADTDAPLNEANILEAIEIWAKGIYDSSGYTALMAGENVHEEISVFNRSQNYPVGYVGAVPGLDGQETAQPLPSTNAPLLVFRTEVPRVVGRKYLPPVSVDQLSAGLLNSTTLTVMGIMGFDLVAPDVVPDLMTFRYVITDAALTRQALPKSYIARPTLAVIGRRKTGRGS